LPEDKCRESEEQEKGLHASIVGPEGALETTDSRTLAIRDSEGLANSA
jgi:hypothetical protein